MREKRANKGKHKRNSEKKGEKEQQYIDRQDTKTDNKGMRTVLISQYFRSKFCVAMYASTSETCR